MNKHLHTRFLISPHTTGTINSPRVTLHDYIFNQKMQLARKLLVQGRNPQVVSNLLGYEYYSSFYHNFVKRFGTPPNSCAELQQKNWKNVDI